MRRLVPLIGVLNVSLSASDEPVSFRNDVMAVLSKAGCNLGTCHGNKSGKGGFRLSLRGQDPETDYRRLTRDVRARRVDRVRPQRSLILLKPTNAVPHEGGQRFEVGSREHSILLRWIEAGLPRDGADELRVDELMVEPRDVVLVEPESSVQLQVSGRFSNGSKRDLLDLAVYDTSNQKASVSRDGLVERVGFGETTVLVRYLHLQIPVRVAFVPRREKFHWSEPPERNYIDRHIFAKLRRLRMNPSGPADDGVLLRRLYLDLLGVLPTEEEARAFVADASPDKRDRMIDELLERPEFSDFWALKWSDLLRLEEKQLDRKGVQNFHHWIRQSISQSKPLDVFAREVLSARGSTYVSPPANFYRANRDSVSRAESAAQVFLGRRLKCAKCHNHPFDRWTQDDYYGWAAVFSRVRYKIVTNRRRDKNDKHEFDGEQIVWMARDGDLTNPRTGQPAPPSFLGEAARSFADDDDLLESVAEWVSSSENPFFAGAQANRIWFHLMGRGLVDPIDDFRATNPASHPELLAELAQDLRSSGFDLRHLARRIVRSQAYQLSSLVNDSNRDDDANFARALIRRLEAEQLLDGLSRVIGVAPRFNGYPDGLRASQIPGVRAVRLRDSRPSAGDEFLRLFGKPARLLACECERSGETTLSQAFQLISGPLLQQMLTAQSNRLGSLLGSGISNREIIETLYWSALTRSPNGLEISSSIALLDGARDRRAALEDLTWAIVNSKEFVLRR
jgi:hypothetical protein